MPLAHDTDNYLYGKGRIYFKPDETGAGYIDLGNIPKFGIEVEVEKSDHYSSRSGTREKDFSSVVEKSAKASLILEEASAENLNIAFMADGIISGGQIADNLDGEEITTIADAFVDLGKTDVSVLKISHGTVANGPFVAGDTITGATSGATGKIAWVGSGFLEVIDETSGTGPFEVGEVIEGTATPKETATISGLETTSDVVVTDHATIPTKRYELGEDYTVDAIGGLLRELSGGTIASNTCYVSCDCAATTTKSIRAFTNAESRGELLFIGDPDDGPRWRVQVWDVNLTVSGEGEFISEEILSIPMEAEFFKDETNHPSEPFFRATETSLD